MEKKLLLAKSLLQTMYFKLRDHESFTIPLVTAGLSYLFTILFFEHFLGLNGLLFTICLILALISVHAPAVNNKALWFTVAGTIASAISLVFIHSSITPAIFFCSLFMMIGLFHARNIKIIPLGIIQYIINSFSLPFTSIHFLFFKNHGGEKARDNFVLIVKYGFIPLLLFAGFAGLYSLASSSFAGLFDWIYKVKSPSFEWSPKFFFFLFSMFLWGAAILPMPWKHILIDTSKFKENVIRKRPLKQSLNLHHNQTLGLKSEYKIAMITFISLNGLTFLLNFIDFQEIWINFSDRPAYVLSQFVHAGTYALIASIFLSIILIATFFRKNLNFIKNHEKIKQLATLWLAQNAFLAFSVCMRNYHYISQYGLTYKRVGVLLFIIIALFCLWFSYIKLKENKSLFWMIKRNAAVAYTILILASAINWDHHMTWLTLKFPPKQGIDTQYLVHDLNQNNTMLLKKHAAVIESHGKPMRYNKEQSAFEQKLNKGRYNTKRRCWAAWTYPHYQLKKLIR